MTTDNTGNPSGSGDVKLPEGVINKPSTTEEVINNEPQPSEQEEVKQPETSPTDLSSLFADQLAKIKSEDGRQKYADVHTALESIPHAQAKINELKQELNELREELNKRKGLEELMEHIEKQSTTTEATPAEGLDEAKLSAMLEAKLAEMKQQEVAQMNLGEVNQKLSEMYGEKAKEQFEVKARELGVDTDTLVSLAARSPKAVLAYFNKPETVSTDTVESTINTTGTPPVEAHKPKPVVYGASTREMLEQFRLHRKE